MEYIPYVNNRDGHIKNGGCLMKFHGILLASIYAIVGGDDALVLVDCSPFISKKIKDKLCENLLNCMYEEEKDRRFHWDNIDSPYR